MRPGYKQTEIGVIPEDWKVVRFLDVTNLITCGLAATPDYVPEGAGYPFLSSSNVKSGRIVWNNFKYIPESLHKQLYRNNPPKKGDVLYSRVGTIGEAAVVDVDFEFSVYVSLTLIKPKPVLDSSYLKHLLNSASYKKRANDQVYLGGGVGNLNVDVVRTYPIVLPSLPEQQVIASVLDDIDNLLAALDRLIAKKRAVKTGAMQQLLTGEVRVGEGGNGRWETKRLGEIAEISMGRTPSRQNSAYWGPGNVWLSIGDMKSKWIYESSEEITDLAASEMTPVPNGTLMMSFKLSIGKLAFAGRDLYTNEAICSFQQLKANPDFLYYMLGRTDFSLYGKQAVKGYTLNKESLNAVEVPYPPLSEQRAIAAILSDIDAEIAALETRRAKTHALKQGMMQELLTGRTRLVEVEKGVGYGKRETVSM
jgi:type I restriction enzyme, S subunit